MENNPQWSSHVWSNELLLEINLAQQISPYWNISYKMSLDYAVEHLNIHFIFITVLEQPFA